MWNKNGDGIEDVPKGFWVIMGVFILFVAVYIWTLSDYKDSVRQTRNNGPVKVEEKAQVPVKPKPKGNLKKLMGPSNNGYGIFTFEHEGCTYLLYIGRYKSSMVHFEKCKAHGERQYR